MPENYEAIYVHPTGATATFVRQNGELDALAKGLDAEQFWVFKNVKALLVRNDEGDLAEANRLMSQIGFQHNVRVLTTPEPAAALAAMREAAFVEVGAPVHGPAGVHMPGPSYSPLWLACAITLAFVGLLFLQTTFIITAIGLVLVFFFMVRWGLEPL